MSDWEDKLNTLLSDPDAMSQIMQLAQSLSSPSGAPPPEAEPAQPKADAEALSSLFSQLTGGLDPALLQRLLPVLGQMNRAESAQTSAFLYALRPFLRENKRDKVERAVQLAKLLHLAKVFLSTREG